MPAKVGKGDAVLVIQFIGNRRCSIACTSITRWNASFVKVFGCTCGKPFKGRLGYNFT